MLATIIDVIHYGYVHTVTANLLIKGTIERFFFTIPSYKGRWFGMEAVLFVFSVEILGNLCPALSRYLVISFKRLLLFHLFSLCAFS
jgi:hypothetical protein